MAAERKRNAQGQFAKKGGKSSAAKSKSKSKGKAASAKKGAAKAKSLLATIDFAGKKFACRGKMVKVKGKSKSRPGVYCAVKA